MINRKTIYDGHTKTLFEGPEDGLLIQHFKDTMRPFTIFDDKKKPKDAPKKVKKSNVTSIGGATDSDVEDKDLIFGKGVLNNRISAYLMTQLDEIGVPTHFIKVMNMREQLVWDTDTPPFEIVVRNLAAKDISERLGIDEGSQMPRSIVEFQLKNEKRQYPIISDEHIIAFGWATQDEIEDIYMMALRVNDFLSGLFLGIGFKLVDVRLEFGRLYYEDESFMILVDELSQNNCRLWPLKENGVLDEKDFGKDHNRDITNYQDIASRLGLLPEGQITADTVVSRDLLDRLRTSEEPIKPRPVKK